MKPAGLAALTTLKGNIKYITGRFAVCVDAKQHFSYILALLRHDVLDSDSFGFILALVFGRTSGFRFLKGAE